ncbi:uncharacterized protein ACLA_026600 [Aspergillus clavatus NRRL 1]|uniref:RNA polymerase I-specific transcription initiation factor RRN6-like protein n=1 Tax=Aspergillus clavatus (strain ATCC 1007 / CBS 513.65 / DSM 816 / NCTC 3887 / NRRL 1 / QM 1276 / 107) TaxID=344612 RepID=A1CQM2_ASPCL|nr:uncharacterized protein ACLA_026600 [Aspergillus clavatus NRRL 1]EAW07943.1 hypothetical protein ACLA_026600 [Aspergillus clavatus NRRL 1]
MNTLRVLCGMGTWEEQYISQRHEPGHFPGACPNEKDADVLICWTTVVSPLTAPQSSLIENKNLLPRVHPELAAGWSLVNNETLSHVITTTSEICDPLTSSLFDLGNAVDIENDDSGNRVVPIAVSASGECGNTISFRKLEEGTTELRHGVTARMRVPMIGESECTEWSTGGAPVRQVCFARTTEEKPTWAAARFPQSITIFRPLYRKQPVSVQIYRDGDRVVPTYTRNSRLDANPLVEISVSQTGGFAHADITFNPWYQKQLAIVDERGNWTVWEVSGRQRRSKGNWAAACVKSGSLPWVDLGEGQDINGHTRHDGWAAIEWVGDVNSFIVSDRRCPMLYRIEGDDILPYAIELGLKRKLEWILDVKRSSCNVSQIFILTTSRIFLLDISSVPVADSHKNDTRPVWFPVLSWRHFRDTEDTTLRLSPLILAEDFYLVLYSRLNHLTLAFQVPPATDGIMDMTSISDPFVLEVPSTSNATAESQDSPNLAQFSTLVFREIAALPSAGSKNHFDATARFVKVFIMDSRLAVRESVYFGNTRESESATEDQQLNKDTLRLRKRYPGVRRKQSTRSHDDFIVDDWDESVLSRGTFTVADSGISNITPLAIPQWAADYSSIYAIAAGKSPAVSSEIDQDQGFQESLNGLVNSASTMSGDNVVFCQTMLDLLDRRPVLDDIDQNAHDFDKFFSQIMSHNLMTGTKYEVIFQPALNLSSHLFHPKLINIYDLLINDWLSNLPHDIPGRSRLTKERIIRNLTAELILTHIIIKRKINNEAEPSRLIANASREDLESSFLPANPGSTSAFGMDERRLPLSTVSPEDRELQQADRHMITQNDDLAQTSNVAGGIIEVEPVYTRLASVTSVNTEGSLSRSAANVLSHWKVGSDPAAYNWQRTTQILEEEETQNRPKAMTPKRRLRKKVLQSTPLSSSQLPPESSAAPSVREWGSQPEVNEPSRIIQLQSSQAIEEDLPMTQVERGMFGGREASRKTFIKARKKKRAAGF